MEREIITISENGVITIPNATTAPIQMRDFEIAELFGIYSQTVRTAIKAILKSGTVAPDYTYDGAVVSKSIFPDYYGLNMITAIAFRIHSPQAQAFRELVLSKLNTVSKLTAISLVVQVGEYKQANRLIN